MLKIKDESKHIEIPYMAAKGQPAFRTIDHFKLQSFRIDLFPIPIVEIILAYCDAEGNITNSTYQFCMREDDALQFLDQSKFESFADHLEAIAAESSKPENKQLQAKGRACGIECELKTKKDFKPQ